MLRRCSWFVLLMGLVLGPSSHAQVRHSHESAVATVERAATFLRERGRAATFAAIVDPHGPFTDGDLYVYALDDQDGQLTMLAHGTNPGLIGMPQKEVVDAEGYEFNKASVAICAAFGAGWVSYKWPNPVTKKIANKSSYVKLVDGVILGAGVYR